jgi:RNA polymerase sigma-70 factor (ECF subfamily)
MSANPEAESKMDAFEAIAFPQIDSIYRFALCMVGNEPDAEDLVQDTYLKAYKLFDKFEDGANCKSWLLKILKNTFINSIPHKTKNRQRAYLSDNEELISGQQNNITPEEEIFANPLEDDVANIINSLPVTFKIVLLLADMEELSYKEISDIIDCPLETVMSRLHRGHKILRKRLQGYTITNRFIIPKRFQQAGGEFL